MKPGFQLTPDAEEDLEEIAAYIAADSVDVALRVVDEIHQTMRNIARRPGIGHRRDDLADESLRVIAVYSYLIIYRSESRPIQVLRVLHGARNLAAILSKHRPKPTKNNP